MGRDKALLPIQGRPLIAWIVERLRSLTPDIVIVARDIPKYTFLGLPVVTDRFPDVGPLAGLHAGLAAVTRPCALAIACDMPFISTQVVRVLIQQCQEDIDVVIPRVHGREQPLHALYRPTSCVRAIEEAIARGQHRLISFLPYVRVRYVDEVTLRTIDPDLKSFLNINTPEEWTRIQEMLESPEKPG